MNYELRRLRAINRYNEQVAFSHRNRDKRIAEIRKQEEGLRQELAEVESQSIKERIAAKAELDREVAKIELEEQKEKINKAAK